MVVMMNNIFRKNVTSKDTYMLNCFLQRLKFLESKPICICLLINAQDIQFKVYVNSNGY